MTGWSRALVVDAVARLRSRYSATMSGVQAAVRSVGCLIRCLAPGAFGGSCWRWASIAGGVRPGSGTAIAVVSAVNYGHATWLRDDGFADSIERDFAARLRGGHRSAPNFSATQKVTGNLILAATGEGQGTGTARQDHLTGLHRLKFLSTLPRNDAPCISQRAGTLGTQRFRLLQLARQCRWRMVPWRWCVMYADPCHWSRTAQIHQM